MDKNQNLDDPKQKGSQKASLGPEDKLTDLETIPEESDKKIKAEEKIEAVKEKLEKNLEAEEKAKLQAKADKKSDKNIEKKVEEPKKDVKLEATDKKSSPISEEKSKDVNKQDKTEKKTTPIDEESLLAIIKADDAAKDAKDEKAEAKVSFFLTDIISARGFSELVVGIDKRFFASCSWWSLVSRKNNDFFRKWSIT